jgi:hypothetical protein
MMEGRLTEREGLFAELDQLKDREIANLKQDMARRETLAEADFNSYEDKIEAKQKQVESLLKKVD